MISDILIGPVDREFDIEEVREQLGSTPHAALNPVGIFGPARR